MYSIKLEKGITMVALIITIIVLLILSSVGIYMGIDSAESTKDAKLISELQMVQHAVLEQYTKFKATKEASLLVGFKLDNTEVQAQAIKLGITLVSIPSQMEHQEYYRLDKAALLALGISKAGDEYIVNYLSGEVINITQEKTSKKKPLYIKANSFLNKE